MKRLPLMIMIIIIGTGITFSQGTKKTVTSDADSGAGSLRQTIAEAVDGDTIVFTGIDTIFIGDPLLLGDKSLIIDGEGAVMLDGRYHKDEALDINRVIEITGVPDKAVTLQNLTIQYGYAKDTVGNYLLEADGGGGGLFAESPLGGELIVTNCTFKNNKATARGGGAKIFSVITTTFTGCDFIENSALDAENGDGGGLYARATTITGCTFTMNSAADFGGGAVVDTLCTVSESSFISNTAGDDGGGLRTQDETNHVSNCTFESNYSGDKGGGVYINLGTATNLVIIGNECLDQGGGAYISKSSMLSDSHIEKNVCSDDGGGVFLNDSSSMYNCVIIGNINLVDDGGGAFMDDCKSHVENCYFANNTAADHAGGLMMRCGTAVNCVFVDNTCADDGGGVYLDDNRKPELPVLIGSFVSGNRAGESGGGLSIEGGNVYNTTFVNNYAGTDGGGIRGKTNVWSVTNSIIFGNDAAGNGDNLQWESNTIAPSFDYCAVDTTNNNGLTAENATNMIMLDNSPFLGGEGLDAYYLAAGSAPIDAGTTLAPELTPATDLHGNPRVSGAAIDMGAFEALQGSSLVVTDKGNIGAGTLRTIVEGASNGDMITFADNIDTIFLELPIELGDKTLSIDGAITGGMVVLDGRFHKDVALDTNRVVTVKADFGRMVTLSNLTISYGNANDGSVGADDVNSNWGGGLWADTDTSYAQLMVMNCTFKNNTSFGRGGGAYSNGPDNRFENCSFIDNSATDAVEGRGGGAAGYFTVFEGCTFSGNYGGDKGGAILVHEGSTANNCVFDGNSSFDGGGAALVEEYGLISNSTFENNFNTDADSDGGAIYLNRGHADGLTVMNNTSADHAGGVYINNDSWIKNSTVSDNTCGDDGGGIYIDEPEGIVDNCIITGNTSADHAGGVFNDDGTLMNSTISGNSSSVDGDGGGVVLDEDLAVMINCEVSNNNSADYGGGVMLKKGGKIINCVIKGNNAADDGGGVYLDNSNAALGGYVVGSIIANNTSADKAGGVKIEQGNILNCVIVNNTGAVFGAVYGDANPWRVTNTIVYGNIGLDGNNGIDGGSTEAVTLNYCAVDDIGNVTEGEIANTLILTESPFVGGAGEDSLMLANMALVDAGSVDAALAFGGVVSDVLPLTDINGDPRILGSAIDMGVYETEKAPVAVTGVTLDQTTLTIDAGLTGTLVATVEPADAANKSVTWSSDNEAAATVADGVVTGVAAGTATITVTTTDGGFTATCVVTVNPGSAAVTGVTLDQTTLSIDVGTTGTLVATVAPADAADKSVTWSSDNVAVATVAGGVVTGVAAGAATITVTTTDGGFTATCAVTVNPVGIDDAVVSGFRLYPNPVSEGKLFLEVSDKRVASFEIYNAVGVLVLKENVNNRTLIELHAPALQESGIYFIKIMKQNTSYVEQIIVQ